MTRSYPAIPESVPRARAELTEFARRAGISGEQLDAVRLSASEAVTNAVLHAYADSRSGAQMIQVRAAFADEGLLLLVVDEGNGLRPLPHQSNGLGLGLALIAQLVDDFQLVSRGAGGTELRMGFRVPAGDRKQQPQPARSRAAAPASA